MKKFIMMLVCTFAMHTMVMADNDKPIQVSQLPAKAQTFIKTYFKDHKVAMAKLESGVFYLKSASNLNGNLNCSKELEHYAS